MHIKRFFSTAIQKSPAFIHGYKEQKEPRRMQPSRLFYNLILAGHILPARLQASTFGVASLTTVFGMGTGVTLQLWPPGNFLTAGLLRPSKS